MEQIISTQGRDVRFERIVPPLHFRSPFDGQEFVLLLVADDAEVADEDRTKLCEEIIEEGCRYAVCVGHDCEKWHDAIDWAFLPADSDFNPPEYRLVLTTWHADESLDDVVLFFLNNTSFDFFKAEKFVICHVGKDAEIERHLKRLIVRLCEGH